MIASRGERVRDGCRRSAEEGAILRLGAVSSFEGRRASAGRLPTATDADLYHVLVGPGLP